jgi:hypothetical protein
MYDPSIGRGVNRNQGMARIAFLGIQIFWLLILGTVGDVISKVVFLKYLSHYIYFLLHACGFWMESFVTLRAFSPFSSLFPFGSRGVREGFCVPFLLRMCMRFSFIFISSFMIFVASILHNECMFPWASDCAHVDEIGCSYVRDSINSSREGIFQVALEVNLTEWNVKIHRIQVQAWREW